ncbi:MAG: helix-turn-helix transcriptional regulator [Actinobacteria bacterium]|nr:helix-turn-helix transcriptional regulator [Actinomycetota bacterium]
MARRTPGGAGVNQRQRLGSKLRALRELAGLRNEDLAAELTLSPATVSRIESGDRLARLSEIDVWVRVTGAATTARDELVSLAEAAATQISPWQSRLHAGVDQTQRETSDLEATAATILCYDHAVVPGLLQVREYAQLVFEMANIGDNKDITGKVDGRMHRQAVLLDQSKQFTILITEAALRWRPGSITLQTEQLRHIRAVTALPNIQIGILPLWGQATTIYPEGFQIYADRTDDADTLVVVELVTDEVTISVPTSVALYLREFDRLRAGAAYDAIAHAVIDRIIADLETERT